MPFRNMDGYAERGWQSGEFPAATHGVLVDTTLSSDASLMIIEAE